MNKTLKTTVNGVELVYEEAPMCSVGDYSGCGDIGEANIRSLKETCRTLELPRRYSSDTDQDGLNELAREGDVDPSCPPQVLFATGDYESRWTYILRQVNGVDSPTPDEIDGLEEAQDILRSLDSYSILDGFIHHQVEEEWKEEAWASWLAQDLSREVDKMAPPELEKMFELMPDDDARELFFNAYYENNIGEFVPEYSGMAFNGLTDVAEHIVDMLVAQLDETKLKANANGWTVEELPEDVYGYTSKSDAMPTIVGCYFYEWQAWQAAAQDTYIVATQTTLDLNGEASE